MWSKAELFEALAARVSCRLEPPDMSFCQLAETPWGKSQLDALRRQTELLEELIRRTERTEP